MSNNQHRAGFALPAVLAVTGVVTLVFLVAITALASLTAEAASARARVRFLQRAMTAEAMISFIGATEPVSQTGFALGSPRSYDEFGLPQTSATSTSQLWLDGRPYELSEPGDLLITLQDQGGMINLAGLSDSQWQAFAEKLGIPTTLARQAGPRFRDYVDTDSLVGPGGAEQSAYGADAVANRSLRRASEWLSVIGMRTAVHSANWRMLRPDVATDHTLTLFNINTATPAALTIMFGLSQAQAQRAIIARQTTPFNSVLDLMAATGGPVLYDQETLYTAPSSRVIYTFRDTRSPWTYRARLTLTPTGLEQPVWIDQTELTEAPRRAVADISDATRFPYAPR